MRKTDKNVVKICYKKRKCASASGGLRPPDPLPRLRPWTPLGDYQTPSLVQFKNFVKKALLFTFRKRLKLHLFPLSYPGLDLVL